MWADTPSSSHKNFSWLTRHPCGKWDKPAFRWKLEPFDCACGKWDKPAFGWKSEPFPTTRWHKLPGLVARSSPAASERGVNNLNRCTGVHHLQENAPPQDPIVGLCLGSLGIPGGGGVFLWAECPCKDRVTENGSNQRQNIAFTGVFVPSSLNSGVWCMSPG